MRHMTTGDVILVSIGALIIAALILYMARDLRRDSGAMPRFWPLDRRHIAAAKGHDALVQRWRDPHRDTASTRMAMVLPPTGSADFATSTAGITAVFGGCRHAEAVPVLLSMTGEKVAVLCPDCDTQLPAEWEAT